MGNSNTLQSQSCRVALSALLHDLGKITQRAKIYDKHERLEKNVHIYCPFNNRGGFHSHKHAACTSLSFDELEEKGYFPDLIDDNVSPFVSRKKEKDGDDITDCLANAAAKHHKPETFLQWCIAIADRVASGFERESFENYNQSQDRTEYIKTELMTIFEQVGGGRDRDQDDYDFSYPLAALSPDSIFPHEKPQNRSEDEASNEYKKLWEELKEGMKKIPPSYRENWSIWLDSFDSLWKTISHAVPSATAFGTKPDVSLYDHSKTTAALAVALWRYHTENNNENISSVKDDWETKKFLLVQGDFFGIQDFIFGGEASTDDKIAKLLRGRSFFVSLLCECAALRVLDALELPATSQIINAAGKFLIVAPNTDKARETVSNVQKEFNEWFYKNTLNLAGIGLACCAASPDDFIYADSGQKPFDKLKEKLYASLDKAKMQRMNLCHKNSNNLIVDINYKNGVCPYDKRLPAHEGVCIDRSELCNSLNYDQIKIGEMLAKDSKNRLLIFRDYNESISEKEGFIKTKIFGYTILFTSSTTADNKEFCNSISKGVLTRIFDISLPEENAGAALWNGCSRRNINTYVPTDTNGEIKSFTDLAKEDRRQINHEQGKEKVVGVEALGVLKGDIDNLGAIFQNNTSSFAKLASLSRQVDSFFSVYLPYICKTKQEFRNIYTVFAGGDDFYMIGPWFTLQKFAVFMRNEFRRYVANNDKIHFSAGYVVLKPGLPLRILSEQSENALEEAKKNEGKNAFAIFDNIVPWNEWEKVQISVEELDEIAKSYRFPAAYMYDLLNFVHMRESIEQNVANARWRSLFYYRTRRMLGNDEKKLRDIADKVGGKIEELGKDYRIALFNHIYRNRNI